MDAFELRAQLEQLHPVSYGRARLDSRAAAKTWLWWRWATVVAALIVLDMAVRL